MAREIRYRGFGSAPALSERLFSSAFIVDRYNPFDWLFSDRADPSLEVLKRYNSAARRAIKALIAQRKIQHVYAMYQIANFYEWLFMSAYKIQDSQAPNNSFISEMTRAVELAIEMANHLLANVDAPTYESLFVDQLNDRPSDMLDALVEITMEAWLGIANRFKGFDDHFWLLAIQSFDKAFPMHRDQPDGVTPFQQRLMIRVLDKLRDNIKGFYPSISRVLLACVGPYERRGLKVNRTAFNILRDGMYEQLVELPTLAAQLPNKLQDFLPDNVVYEYANASLTHAYRGGTTESTNLRGLVIPTISLVDPALRNMQQPSLR